MGTAIGLFLRRPDHVDGGMAEVGYREFWGTCKREELLESIGLAAPPPYLRKSSAFPDDDPLDKGGSAAERRHSLKTVGMSDGEAEFRRTSSGKAATESKLDEQPASPETQNRFSLQPGDVSISYQSWPTLDDLSGIVPITGYKENRGFKLIDSSKDALRERMKQYFDKGLDWDSFSRLKTGLETDAARFDAKKGQKESSGKRGICRNTTTKVCTTPV